MHTYRDAIRRTGGAYVLYPGTVSDRMFGFHELLPGLGAFAISPSELNDGSKDLKKFIQELVEHFMNRASQREKISLKTYQTFKENKPNELKEPLPESYGVNRTMIPDETYVLVAFYDKKKWDWIIKNGLYNARADNSRGSLRLGPKEAGASYLLLHSEGEIITSKLLRINKTGPKILSKKTLIAKGYPTEPSQDYYLVYNIEEIKHEELKELSWDIKKLEGYKKGRGSGLPFSITMTELMNVVLK